MRSIKSLVLVEKKERKALFSLFIYHLYFMRSAIQTTIIQKRGNILRQLFFKIKNVLYTKKKCKNYLY